MRGFEFLLFASTALAQQGAWTMPQTVAVRAADGGWFTAAPPGISIQKRTADLEAVVWERRIDGWSLRELRATPDGGVSVLALDGGRALLSAWDRDGGVRFSTQLLLPGARFGVEGNGTYLVAGGSLDVYRISVDGRTLDHKALRLTSTGWPAGVEADGHGGVYIAGNTNSDFLETTPNAYQRQRRSGTCSFSGPHPFPYQCSSGWMARLNADTLDIEALTYLGGAAENFLTALAIDRTGLPVVAGYTSARAGDAEPFPRTAGTPEPVLSQESRSIATVTRMTSDLSEVAESAWLSGGIGAALGFDAEGRALIGGGTMSPDFPRAAGWSQVCGPQRDVNSPHWGFAVRLSERFERVERVLQFGDVPVGRLEVDDRGKLLLPPEWFAMEGSVACLVNGGNYEFSREVAAGQLMTMIGGPFADDAPVSVGGVDAPVLYRSQTQINFVVPRALETRESATLDVGGEAARVLRIRPVRPVWKWFISPDGRLVNRGNNLIDARRADSEQNSDERPFRADEEVRAYATGINLERPVRLLFEFDQEYAEFVTSYVPGTFDSVVEFKFRNPYPRLRSGGMMVLGIENDGVRTPMNPGYIWNELSPAR